MAMITSKMGVVKLKDDTGTPIECTLAGPGDFTMNGLEAAQAEAIAIYERGTFVEHVEGDDIPVTGQITVHHNGDITDNTTKQPVDAVMKTGAFSAGVTTDPGAVVWTTDIVVTYTRGAVVHTWTLSTCRVKIDSYTEAKDVNKYVLYYTCQQGVAYTSA